MAETSRKNRRGKGQEDTHRRNEAMDPQATQVRSVIHDGSHENERKTAIVRGTYREYRTRDKGMNIGSACETRNIHTPAENLQQESTGGKRPQRSNRQVASALPRRGGGGR